MKLKAVIAGVLLSLVLSQTVMAEPYQGYTYNSYGEIVSTPNVYLPEKIIQGTDLGIGHFNKPTDLFKDKNNNIYVLDAGNNRVVVLDKDLKVNKVIAKFNNQGKAETLKNPGGIFVDDNGVIYIADAGNARVLKMDSSGNILGAFGKPKTELLSDETVYSPKKVVVNSIGTMFILSDNINQGLVEIDKAGTFIGFFGSDKIQANAAMLKELFWRKFSTKAQIAQRTSFQPLEYSNVFIDKNDFIYTSVAYNGIEKAQLRKLNPNGKNLLAEVGYGDYKSAGKTSSQFADITVDDDQFIFAVEKQYGNIFMYDQKSDLLGIFSGMGNTPGNFKEGVALETLGDKVLGLDIQNCNIIVFKPTEYCKYIREGVKLQEVGKSQEALAPWTKVQKLNTNYEMAYVGIGRALYLTGDYKGAMKNFELGNNKTEYSKAKKDYRTAYLRQHFTLMVTGFILLIIALNLLNKKKKAINSFLKGKFNFVFKTPNLPFGKVARKETETDG
jgi:DNA-binding beta-propeller fold protein YncE